MDGNTVELRKRRIKRNIENLERELERLDSLEDDPFADGEVIRFTKEMGGQMYTYAAIRCNGGQWFTTGPRSPKYASWYDLIRFIGTDIPIEWAAVWEEME